MLANHLPLIVVIIINNAGVSVYGAVVMSRVDSVGRLVKSIWVHTYITICVMFEYLQMFCIFVEFPLKVRDRLSNVTQSLHVLNAVISLADSK